jgi:starvation-inducible DNA-binding protein
MFEVIENANSTLHISPFLQSYGVIIMNINTGISAASSEIAVKHLSAILSDTYLLYLKTQNFHWNVISPSFHSLHLMFEGQYGELVEAVDTLAERIRALGHPAPGSFSQFTAMASIKESSTVPKATDMLKQLLADHELMSREIHQAITAIEQTGDEVTVDLLVQRLTQHEKTAWMLRSSIE